jgi:hypothetical protein
MWNAPWTTQVACHFNRKRRLILLSCLVRLYVVRATGLAALDGGNSSDPYLVASLGDTTFKCRESVVKGTLKPYFGQVFEFETTMPGPAELKLAVYDWDLVGKDDLIGATSIDLEDRFFSAEWRALSRPVSHSGGAPQPCWPIESRTLRDRGSYKSRGKVECWIDILHKTDARSHPVIDIAMAPPEEFELRVLLYLPPGNTSGRRHRVQTSHDARGLSRLTHRLYGTGTRLVDCRLWTRHLARTMLTSARH